MQVEEIQKIGVLGAGIMGHGIALSFLMEGFPVHLYDVDQGVLDVAARHIEEGLRLFAEAGLMEEGRIASALGRLSPTLDLKEAVADSDFVIEAAPEDLALKQGLFEMMEAHCSSKAILASNTSSLTLKRVGERVKNRGRLVITHWFNPPHIVPTVEVVKGEETTEETLDTAYNLLLKIKKVPVKIQREMPGFLVNRVQIAMAREILSLCEAGVASPADIDSAIKGSIGFRLASIGPLLTMDLAGLGLWLRVCENLLPEISSSTAPPKVLQEMVEKGQDGIKTGRGFYDYTTDFTRGALDEAIKKRDREFLGRLKNLYR